MHFRHRQTDRRTDWLASWHKCEMYILHLKLKKLAIVESPWHTPKVITVAVITWPYGISLPVCGVLFQRLYLGPFSRHCHFWSERDCLWPWELLHIWQRRLNYKPHALSHLCVNISKLNCALFMSYSHLQQKWPSNSLKVISILAINSPYMIFYFSSFVTMSLSCTVSEILSLISEN